MTVCHVLTKKMQTRNRHVVTFSELMISHLGEVAHKRIVYCIRKRPLYFAISILSVSAILGVK